MHKDCDLAGDAEARQSCSGGRTEVEGDLCRDWGKFQSNLALSSGEAEVTSVGKGISEGRGASGLCKDIYGAQPSLGICVDGIACKGILLRTGAGRAKGLTTNG